MFYCRYRNHQQISNLQRTARYVIISAAILILFTITIVVHLPKATKNEIPKTNSSTFVFENEISTLENIQSLEYNGLDLRHGSEELLKNLSDYYQQVGQFIHLLNGNRNVQG